MDTILFIRTFSNGKPVYQTRLEGVIHVARERGWQVQTVDKPAPADVGALLRFWKPLGCVVESGSYANAYRPRLFGNTPVVYLDRDPETLRNAFCVSCDNRATAATAARELLSLGIGNFAFVPNFTFVSWSQSREREFRQLLKLNGRTVDVFRPTEKGETPAWRTDLARWLVWLPKPCAVMAANDPVGEAVLVTAASLDIAVPDELAVIGVDNSEIICENTQPPLSSVALDFLGAGKIAAELLAERILHPDMKPCCRRFCPIGIVRRCSTRRFNYRDSRILAAASSQP